MFYLKLSALRKFLTQLPILSCLGVKHTRNNKKMCISNVKNPIESISRGIALLEESQSINVFIFQQDRLVCRVSQCIVFLLD